MYFDGLKSLILRNSIKVSYKMYNNKVQNVGSKYYRLNSYIFIFNAFLIKGKMHVSKQRRR